MVSQGEDGQEVSFSLHIFFKNEKFVLQHKEKKKIVLTKRERNQYSKGASYQVKAQRAV